MPYIKQERRPVMDDILVLMTMKGIKYDGDLNYLLFKFCKDYVEPSYGNYKKFIGELEECVAEIRRKILAPYEEQKEKENGGI